MEKAINRVLNKLAKMFLLASTLKLMKGCKVFVRNYLSDYEGNPAQWPSGSVSALGLGDCGVKP